jgi:CDP-glycerol glycerophosphotransferase (TagB/SpsB family)
MLVSDVLVTDYSSAIYEFALLGKPMVFFAPDHEAYERERGFYFDYRTGVPGPIFETTSDVGAYLRAGVFDLGRVDRVRRESFDVADGHATARVTDQLILPALTGAGGPS